MELVCRALGLETTTRSADYIQLYRGNTQTLSDSLEMIQKTAATLIAQLQDESNNSQQEEHYAALMIGPGGASFQVARRGAVGGHGCGTDERREEVVGTSG